MSTYFIHCGHEDFGGDLFGPYDSLRKAANGVARLVTKAHETDCHNIGARSYTIIQALDYDAAEAIVAAQVKEKYSTV
jgi:hypothetical protein